MSIGEHVADAIIRRAKRTPYFHLRGYMGRWWLFRTIPTWSGDQWMPGWLGGRVHHIIRSDDDRACHCHPWPYLTLILKGGYWEIREFTTFAEARRRGRGPIERVPIFRDGIVHDFVYHTRRWHGPGSILFRRSTDRHRLELAESSSSWSLFITGPKAKSWFFYLPEGPVNWRDYPPAVEDNVVVQLTEWVHG